MWLKPGLATPVLQLSSEAAPGLSPHTISFSVGTQPAACTGTPQTGIEPHLFEAVALECVRGDRLLFSDLSLALQPGQLLHIEGTNGSGKTSLLRILCGLAAPSGGEVRWQGRAIHKIRQVFMNEVAYIGHNHGVKGDLTPLENVRIACHLGRVNDKVSIEEALYKVGLGDFYDVPARTLSAGQRRRVALSCLLATHSRLWVLDEPLTALDIKGVGLVEEMLSEHLLHGGMAVVTTHHPLSVGHGHMIRMSLN